MSSIHRSIAAVVSAATAQGWRHAMTANNRHQFYSPDKKTIVVVSNNSTDPHAFKNFMSEMKSGGYTECDAQSATQSLGDALQAAKLNATKLEELNEPLPQQRQTLPQIVIGFLERRGVACTAADIAMVVKHHRPNAQHQSIVSQIGQLAAVGRIRRIAHGLYAAALPPTIAAAAIATSAPSQITQAKSNGALHAPDNGAIIDELLAMQTALIAALGRVESIVQRLRNGTQP